MAGGDGFPAGRAGSPSAAPALLSAVPAVGLQATPSQVMFASLLALPAPDLAAVVDAELARNPALVVEGGIGPAAGFPGDVPAAVSRVDRLLSDVAGGLPGRDRWLVHYVLADLDARGLLGRPARDLAAELNVPLTRVERVLVAIRAVGPPGIAATDVGECLRLQVRALRSSPEPPPPAIDALLDPLLDALWGDRPGGAAMLLSRGREGLARLCAQLKAGPEAVNAALALIRQRCRPYALLADDGPAPPAVPTVDLRVVEGADGELHVVADAMITLSVDSLYRRLSETPVALTTVEANSVADHVRRAGAFLSCLQQRTDTLVRVATAAVRRQAGFLRCGPSAHRRLTRAEVAADLGLCESTVSRAVTGKRLRGLDGRVLPLAALFGGSVSVRDALASAARSAGAPQTDAQLAAALSAAGYRVARRTVAKYRRQMGIASSRPSGR